MSGVVEELQKVLGECVRTDAETRKAHRSDSWMLAELKDFEGREEPVPLAVVEAKTTADVAQCLETCGRLGTEAPPEVASPWMAWPPVARSSSRPVALRASFRWMHRIS